MMTIIARDGGAARTVADEVVKKKVVKAGLFDPGPDWKFDITAIPDDQTCLISFLEPVSLRQSSWLRR